MACKTDVSHWHNRSPQWAQGCKPIVAKLDIYLRIFKVESSATSGNSRGCQRDAPSVLTLSECTEDFEMQQIKLKASSLWSSKFTELCKELEGTEKDQGSFLIHCWKWILNEIWQSEGCMCNAFSIWIHVSMWKELLQMKSILSPPRRRLTTDHSEACVQLKVSKYSPDSTRLSDGKQGQGSH